MLLLLLDLGDVLSLLLLDLGEEDLGDVLVLLLDLGEELGDLG